MSAMGLLERCGVLEFKQSVSQFQGMGVKCQRERIYLKGMEFFTYLLRLHLGDSRFYLYSNISYYLIWMMWYQ